MLKRFFQMSDALGELLCGILFFGILCQIGLIIFLSGSGGYYSTGLWIGILLAMGMALHMTWSLDKALDYAPSDAIKKMRSYSLLRYAAVLIILGLMMIFDPASPLTAFLGLMGLKVGAYIQPFTHKAAIRLGLKPPDPEAKPLEEIEGQTPEKAADAETSLQGETGNTVE
ncbi:MAG: hypothetical protein IK078_12330 [Lachnospiraceae bacterium]|nr:hypothetical protein [Lachnospiraceae bacterium]